MVLELLIKRSTIAGITAVGGILLLIVFVFLIKKAVEEKELKTLAEDRKREETLEGVLRNVHEKSTSVHGESTPYEVDYIQNERRENLCGKNQAGVVMLQLVEYDVLSTRKYMMNPEKVIRIGSNAEGNSIVVSGIGKVQCEIFTYQGGIYIRDVGEKPLTRIKRRKQQVYVEGNGVRLQTGDKIILGKVSFDVAIIK